MAEETESVRQDSATRAVKDEKQVQDWSGKRLILPRGTTVPASGLPGEIFVKIKDAAGDVVMLFDEDVNRFATVGTAQI